MLDVHPPHFRETMLHYGYIDPRLNRLILCCEDARFINHTNTPNLRAVYETDWYGVDMAIRDIAAGEKLTIDYGTVEGSRPE